MLTLDHLQPSDPDEYSSSDDDRASSFSPSPARMYRGSPTRTMLIQAERKRVAKKPIRTEVPNTPHVKQARNGKVKAFSPKIYKHCCKRRCCKNFNDAKDEQLVLARQPLFDATLSREAMRVALRNNAVDLLRHKEDGDPVCNVMVNIAYSCSTSFLNPSTTRSNGSQGDSNRRRAKIILSVMSWFKRENELSDVMPDSGDILLSYPKRSAVWEQYMHDCDEVTACSQCPIGINPLAVGPCGCEHSQPLYLKASEAYFKSVWASHYPHCKIRKHMRFSKCTFCVLNRSVKNDRKRGEVERVAARTRLSGHYDWIRRERAEEISKVGSLSLILPALSRLLTHDTPLT